MNKYYKTSRDSETGVKIKALVDRADEFDKQVENLRKKYGFTKTWVHISHYRNLSAVEFKSEPDMEVWEKVEGVYNGYLPRCSSKNKEVLDDFMKLNSLSVSCDELDAVIGNNASQSAGFDFSIPEVYIFSVESDWDCEIPKDCEECDIEEYCEYDEYEF